MVHQGLQSVFPENFEELKSIIVDSSRETHDKHADAQAIMDPGGSRGYGNSMWVNLPSNICKAVTERFPSAYSLKLPHAAFPVPVVEGCVIYAYRHSDDLTRNDGFIGHKTLERLMNESPSFQLTLFDEEWRESEDFISEDKDVTAISPEGKNKLVLVVVRSTPNRLDSIWWGEVKKNKFGVRHWGDVEALYQREELPLAPVQSHAHTFSDGQPPKPFIKPQPAVHKKPL